MVGHTCPRDRGRQPGQPQPRSPAVSGGCCPLRGLWSGCWRPAWCGNLRKTSCARTGAGGRFCPRWQEGRDVGEDLHCKAGLRGSVAARTGAAHPQAPGPAHTWGFPPITAAAPYPRAPMIIIFRSTFLLASMDGPCRTRGGHPAAGMGPAPGEPRGAGGSVGAACCSPPASSHSHPGRPGALDTAARTVCVPCQYPAALTSRWWWGQKNPCRSQPTSPPGTSSQDAGARPDTPLHRTRSSPLKAAVKNFPASPSPSKVQSLPLNVAHTWNPGENYIY